MVVTYMIQPLEDSLGVIANKNSIPMQPGDVYQTYVDDLFSATQYKSSIKKWIDSTFSLVLSS